MSNNQNEILEIADILLETSRKDSNKRNNKAYTAFDTDTIIKYGCDGLNGATALYNKGYRIQRPMPYSEFCTYTLKDAEMYGMAQLSCDNCSYTDSCKSEVVVCKEKVKNALITEVLQYLEVFNEHGDNIYAIKLIKNRFMNSEDKNG